MCVKRVKFYKYTKRIWDFLSIWGKKIKKNEVLLSLQN